jgi:hypothetical protein
VCHACSSAPVTIISPDLFLGPHGGVQKMLGLSFEEIRAKVKDAIKKQIEVGRAWVEG